MNIAVAGTGYVGLVAGVCFAEKGHHVTCVDMDEKKIKLMEAGVSPIYENELEELMKKPMQKAGCITPRIINPPTRMPTSFSLALVLPNCRMAPLIFLILQ